MRSLWDWSAEFGITPLRLSLTNLLLENLDMVLGELGYGGATSQSWSVPFLVVQRPKNRAYEFSCSCPLPRVGHW